MLSHCLRLPRLFWALAWRLALRCPAIPAPYHRGHHPPGPPLLPDEIRLKIDRRCPGTRAAPTPAMTALRRLFRSRHHPDIEPFTDQNGNGVWDAGEPYTDKNGNGKFDEYWIAGYGNGRLATGVADPIWARAIAIRQNQTTVVLVSVDTVGLFRDESLAIEKRLDPRLGIDLFMLHATHDHEAPDRPAAGVATSLPTASTRSGIRRSSITSSRRCTRQCRGYKAGARQHLVGARRGSRWLDAALRQRLAAADRHQQPPAHPALRRKRRGRPAALDRHAHQLGQPSRGRRLAESLLTSDFVHTLRDEVEKQGAGRWSMSRGARRAARSRTHAEPLDETGKPIKENGLPRPARWDADHALCAAGTGRSKGDLRRGRAARLQFRSALVTAHIENMKYHWASMLRIFRRSFCCYDQSQPFSDDNLPQVETKLAYLQLGPAAIVTNPGELAPELLSALTTARRAAPIRCSTPKSRTALI